MAQLGSVDDSAHAVNGEWYAHHSTPESPAVTVLGLPSGVQPSTGVSEPGST